MDFLKGKPASITCTITDATYNQIKYAIQQDSVSNEKLKQIKQMCREYPSSVMCVVYRSFEDSVLFIYGSTPNCIVVDGCRLASIMSRHNKENHVYLFTYVK
mgnify:CR=1 FL=1|tara:strand:+ start:953 stop:1258 length:306 start_codon:yes stop_codon:yes gene_type:complete